MHSQRIMKSDLYRHYYSYLMDLVSMPSVFDRPEDIKKVTDYCFHVFKNCLKNYEFIQDEAGNLIIIPQQINPTLPILYLSAHADTVDADASFWSSPYAPFIPYEDENEIVARGVSDCKAGLAFQLFLASLISQDKVQLPNTVFTVTFKEEGPGLKTSSSIGKMMGSRYPLSDGMTYLLVLENTVKLTPEPTLNYFTTESGNYTIKLTGSINELRHHFKKLIHWNPVAIWPHIASLNFNQKVLYQKGGHVCTTSREQNLLTETILQSQNGDLILAGNETTASSIPPQIQIMTSQEPLSHTLVLTQRSLATKRSILNELQEIPIVHAELLEGLNIQSRFKQDPIAGFLSRLNGNHIRVEEDSNPGTSDASIIFNQLTEEKQQKVLPIIIGPGTRSQRNRTPPRLTHGPNETFDKKSGMQSVQTLMDLCSLINNNVCIL